MNFYNIFIRAFPNWNCIAETINSADKMGFDAIYINACFLPGKSNSIYSIKDYYTLDKQSFQGENDAKEGLAKLLALCQSKNMPVIMDLVINHTSIDNILTKTHRNWYFLDEAGEVQHPYNIDGEKTVRWMDSAWLNYENADRSLWKYMLNMALYWLDEGFSGFRCDVANSVYPGFWRYLISETKKKFPNTLFLAEAFTSPPEKILALADAGFDYFFNSSKWWDFNEPWLLEQYNRTKNHIPSISIPDNHDTERAMRELNGNIAQYFRRLYFTGFFSKGFMMTCGFENGFKNKLHVCNTTGDDWENTGLDFTADVAKMIELKKRYAPLHEECDIEVILNDDKVLCLLKIWRSDKILMIINKKDILTPVPLNILNEKLNFFGFKNIKTRLGKLALKSCQVQLYESSKGFIMET